MRTSVSKKTESISEIMRKKLLLLMIITFVLSVVVISMIYTLDFKASTAATLEMNVEDVKQDILGRADDNLLRLTRIIAYDNYEGMKEHLDNPNVATALEDAGYPCTEDGLLQYLKYAYEVDEITEIGEDGTAIHSTNPSHVGINIASTKEASEFLPLLTKEEVEYVQPYQTGVFDEQEAMKYAGVSLNSGGCLLVGYGFDKFLQDIGEDIIGITDNRHIGETGRVFAIAEDGTILTRSSDKKEWGNIEEFGYSMSQLEALVDTGIHQGHVGGARCYLTVTKVEGYYLIAYITAQEAHESRTTTLFMTVGLEVAAFTAIFLLVYYLMKRLVLDNLRDVTSALDKITDGNLDVAVDVRGNLEFEALSNDINETVNALKEHIDKEAKRIDTELEFAKIIQQSSLPMIFPPFPDRTDFEIYASMRPAKEVGGDFFDFGLVGDRYLAFCVADVSGKGVPAAMLMMRAKTLIKDYSQTGMKPADVLTVVNDVLCENNPSGMFITCWAGVLDTETGRLNYANAGHNPPLVYRKGKGFTYLREEKPNLVLAGMEGVHYRQHFLDLGVGDQLFVYTDGVVEATNPRMELYGEPRLQEVLNFCCTESCRDECETVYEDVLEFAEDAPQFDDITMLCIRYSGKENNLTDEANLSKYDKFMHFISERLRMQDCPDGISDRIMIAADEIIANVMNYAYGEAEGRLTVRVEPLKKRRGAKITFTDYGVPFNPLNRQDPDIHQKAEERSVGGLGIYMVKKMMDKVEYSYSNSNNLSMTKYFDEDPN